MGFRAGFIKGHRSLGAQPPLAPQAGGLELEPPRLQGLQPGFPPPWLGCGCHGARAPGGWRLQCDRVHRVCWGRPCAPWPSPLRRPRRRPSLTTLAEACGSHVPKVTEPEEQGLDLNLGPSDSRPPRVPAAGGPGWARTAVSNAACAPQLWLAPSRLLEGEVLRSVTAQQGKSLQGLLLTGGVPGTVLQAPTACRTPCRRERDAVALPPGPLIQTAICSGFSKPSPARVPAQAQTPWLRSGRGSCWSRVHGQALLCSGVGGRRHACSMFSRTPRKRPSVAFSLLWVSLWPRSQRS